MRLHSFPTRRSSDLSGGQRQVVALALRAPGDCNPRPRYRNAAGPSPFARNRGMSPLRPDATCLAVLHRSLETPPDGVAGASRRAQLVGISVGLRVGAFLALLDELVLFFTRQLLLLGLLVAVHGAFMLRGLGGGRCCAAGRRDRKSVV